VNWLGTGRWRLARREQRVGLDRQGRKRSLRLRLTGTEGDWQNARRDVSSSLLSAQLDRVRSQGARDGRTVCRIAPIRTLLVTLLIADPPNHFPALKTPLYSSSPSASSAYSSSTSCSSPELCLACDEPEAWAFEDERVCFLLMRGEGRSVEAEGRALEERWSGWRLARRDSIRSRRDRTSASY
jgi:hypothetical protein